MKKAYVLVLILVAVVAGVWIVRSKRAGAQEEGEVETEVAVRVGKITRSTLRAYVTAYGTVEAAPAGDLPSAAARVTAPVAGVITKVSTFEGQRVKKGDVLFQLDSRTADAAVERAQLTEQFAEMTAQRQQKLLEVDGTSRKALLEAQQALTSAKSDLAAARVQQALLRVQAPLTGVVVHVGAKSGDGVDLSTTLAELVDLDRLVVRADVPTAELSSVATGQAAELDVAGPAERAPGSVVYVGSQVDAKTGTAEVRVSVPAGTGLRPGQLVTLRIVTLERKDCLAVPIESLTKNAEGVSVIALVQGEKAVETPVREGLRDGGLVEVEGDGLAADLPVVTEGAYGLPAETRIRVIGQ